MSARRLTASLLQVLAWCKKFEKAELAYWSFPISELVSEGVCFGQLYNNAVWTQKMQSDSEDIIWFGTKQNDPGVNTDSGAAGHPKI